MSKPRWLKQVEEKAVVKPVLLVEGNTDLRILSYFLEQVSPGWAAQIIMLPAKRKSQVIEGIQTYHPEWVGIVDKDEWPVDRTVEVLQDTPRVKALPRFCLENYFCVPDELWSALPSTSKQRLKNRQNSLKDPILALLPDWVAHGAMWRVIRKRRTVLLQDSGFPAKLDRKPVTDLTQIRQILEAWHNQLDPKQIIADYEEELASAQKLSTDEQLQTYIHGKKFFRQVVVPTLNRLFAQQSPRTWLERFSNSASGVTTPPDLYQFLQDVLSLFK